jgi:hypothetical protein
MRPKFGRGFDKASSVKSQERRVAAYLRVSTEEQAENPEGSIKNQEERIKMVLALKNADTPFGTLQGVYCDAGRSGKDLNRPELQRLLKAIAAREIDMVIVSELSRLTRSIKDFSLRIVEDEAKTVRVVFQAVLVHGSVSQAAKWLNENGYVLLGPLRGGGFRPRRKHFTFDSLYRLVANQAYAGRRVIRKKAGKVEFVPAVWPALIDPDLFDRTQKCLADGKMQKTGRESRYPYLLSTRIFCGECQAPLIGNSAHGRAGKLPYYGHGSQIRREHALKVKGHRCDPFCIPGRKLEDRV